MVACRAREAGSAESQKPLPQGAAAVGTKLDPHAKAYSEFPGLTGAALSVASRYLPVPTITRRLPLAADASNPFQGTEAVPGANNRAWQDASDGDARNFFLSSNGAEVMG